MEIETADKLDHGPKVGSERWCASPSLAHPDRAGLFADKKTSGRPRHLRHRYAPPVALLISLLLAGQCLATVFVDTDAAPGGDGNSWSTAYRTIQAGIDDADALDEEVWVAEGIYTEAITMKDGVAVYGGFTGTETLLSQRHIVANMTSIDASTADGGAPANHVVAMSNISSSRVDGFTLTGGDANESGPGQGACGGGIYCSALDDSNTIASCTITGNSASYDGGGVHCEASSPTIANCTIARNTADYHGGGVRCGGGSAPMIADCVIADNSADQGGGVYCTAGSEPTIANCMIIGNSAGGDGGGVHFTSEYVWSYPMITNCVIAGNSAYWDGGGVYCRDLSCPTVVRCVVSGNSARDGAGMMCASDSAETIINCTISGNAGSGSGGGIFCSESAAIITNNTIAANSSSAGGGVCCDWYSTPTITNTVFVDNTQHAVYESQSSDPIVSYCLFYGNEDGDYYDEETGSHTGAESVNLNVAEASDNIDGSPRFAMDLGAVWTASPTYNPSTNRTTLTAAGASLAPSALVGSLLNPNTSQRRQVFITANTATTIQVVGDLTGYVASEDTYQLIDYHLLHGSPCIDVGTQDAVPSTDMDGNPRPIDIAGLGADRTGTEFDIGADEFSFDTDGDGLHDADERRDLDPESPDVQNPFEPYEPDSTGDDFSDVPDGVPDGQNDYDGDGMSNADEFTFGYNPIDPGSWAEVPAFTGIGLFVLIALALAARGRGRERASR
jgi:hypothetical protein